MKNNFRTDMAKMFALIERMDKHSTMYEADLLNEAFNDSSNVGVLKPQVEVVVDVDSTKKLKEVSFIIHPVRREDALAIKRKNPNVEWISNYKGQTAIVVRKTFQISKEKVKTNKTDTTSQTPDNTQQTQQKFGKLASKFSGLLNKGNVNEGLMDKFAKRMAAQNQQPQQTTQDTGAKQPSQNENVVYNFLNTTYMSVVNELGKNSFYDQDAINKLKDIDNIYQIYLGTPTSEDNIYVEQSTDELKNEITKAINDGNWDQYLRSVIKPLSIDQLIFGNVLSNTNQRLVNGIKNQLGLGSNEHNLIFAPSIWRDRFGRKIKDNPVASYPMIVPMRSNGRKGGNIYHNDDGMGTAAHVENFYNTNGRYGKRLGYSYEDTEPIDPNDTNDYINGIPGILNNLTGELNQKAIDAKNRLKAETKTILTPEEEAKLKDFESNNGKAMIYNECLQQISEEYQNLGASIISIDDSNKGNAVNIYAQNLLNIASKLINQPRADIAEIQRTITAFGIACFTVGTNEVLSMSGNMGNRTNLKDDWKKYADEVIQNIRVINSNIAKIAKNMFKSISNKVINLVRNSGQTQQTQTQQAPNVQQSVNEIHNKLEKLLFDF